MSKEILNELSDKKKGSYLKRALKDLKRKARSVDHNMSDGESEAATEVLDKMDHRTKIMDKVSKKLKEEMLNEFLPTDLMKLGPKLKGLGKKGLEAGDDALKSFEKEADQPLGPTVKPGTAPELPKVDAPPLVPRLPRATRPNLSTGPKSSRGAKPAIDPKSQTKVPGLGARMGAGAGGALAAAGIGAALGALGGGITGTNSDARDSRVHVKTSVTHTRKRVHHEEFTVNSAPTPKKREDDPGILRPKDSQKKPTTLSRKTQIVRNIIEDQRALSMASIDMKRKVHKQFGLQSVPQDVHGNPLNWLRYTDSGSPYDNLKTHVELGGKRFEKLETALKYFKNAGKNLISQGKENLKNMKEETKPNAIKKAIEDERKKRLSLQNPWIQISPEIKSDSKNTDNISIDLYN